MRERRRTLAESVTSLEQLKSTRSDLRMARAELVEASKLTALGTLAAGIAHEMNQPLTVIMGLADVMAEHGSDSIGEHADELDDILEASEHLAQIIQNVLMFARQTEAARELTRASAPLSAAIQLLNQSLRHRGIELSVDMQSVADLRVAMNSSRMQQVFINLLLNARDALTNGNARGDRRIRVGADRRNGLIVYEVADNGPGIDDEHVGRLFDPFFTTKPVGQGVGLGLSVSHGIVAEHEGELRFRRDEPWTAFEVAIPASTN
ncbi:MAG: ATP-binding protein [Gemmatimonadetes bacterium]|nr:ATP-binding protein [Gemmatimonadota bacterium]